jgi:hypothetical protein
MSMRHRTLDEVTQVATITSVQAPSSREVRRERLRRLATVLERYEGPIRLLSQIEHVPLQVRRQLRADFSPLALAYQDDVLRREGLPSDRLGDAVTFFGLSQRQAHHMFCDCHYGAAITSRTVARRVHAVAERKSITEWSQMIWARLAHA